MNDIINTAKDEQHPEWLFGGDPGSIEAQEARGQSQLIASTQLPVNVTYGDRRTLEDAGVIFGEPKVNDTLFCDVTLPEGWQKRRTDNPMWSDLIDETGKIRARIFYKAAFYDREAFLSIEPAG